MSGMAGKNYAGTNKDRLKSIPLGSGNVYAIKYDPESPSVPTDEQFEKDENMVGRTSSGATFNYSSDTYTAKSDDGIAKKRRTTDETASFSWGVMTWNIDTVEKMISTAVASTEGTGANAVDVVKIGGVARQTRKLYWYHFVGGDDTDGKITLTGLGENNGSLEAAFSDDNETVLTPDVEFDPCDSDGTLVILKMAHFTSSAGSEDNGGE